MLCIQDQILGNRYFQPIIFTSYYKQKYLQMEIRKKMKNDN